MASATLVPSLRLRRTEYSTWSPVSSAFPTSSPSSTCSTSFCHSWLPVMSHIPLHAEHRKWHVGCQYEDLTQ